MPDQPVQNPPPNMQRIVPSLAYDDAPAAIEFLCRAFGFQEAMRMPMPDGQIGHAELVLHGNTLMLASSFREAVGIGGPRELPHLHSSVSVYVDDVDAHYAQAAAAGATILEPLTDQFWGDRTYRAEDPEGQRWMFQQHIRDVSQEEMRAALESME